jgi:hypothetical protein
LSAVCGHSVKKFGSSFLPSDAKAAILISTSERNKPDSSKS